ncbi:hypothetical protein HNY73_023002 [Argiope bruennichi]|uniref:Uncharacterized protein n=1 Tax=Argiope bruennichi TaxID=94029 RepID=A0A8T0E6E7_ARGBR|nr:hypothetical protein HNY73_023002 [Argiope bruennichi]
MDRKRSIHISDGSMAQLFVPSPFSHSVSREEELHHQILRQKRKLLESKNLCSDPKEGKGNFGHFKWDCFNHQWHPYGYLHGRFYSEPCQYDYDPLLVEDALDEYPVFMILIILSMMIIEMSTLPHQDEQQQITTQSTPGKSYTHNYQHLSTRQSTTTTPIRPVVTTIRSTAITRPATTTTQNHYHKETYRDNFTSRQLDL